MSLFDFFKNLSGPVKPSICAHCKHRLFDINMSEYDLCRAKPHKVGLDPITGKKYPCLCVNSLGVGSWFVDIPYERCAVVNRGGCCGFFEAGENADE